MQEDVPETAPPLRHRPEPPAALAATTRFTQHEIKLIYRGFKQECPTGVVDEESFKHIFSQFFPLGDASQYASLVFNSIQHQHSGRINFEEFLKALSLLARGAATDQLRWVFTLYDGDGDGRVSKQDLTRVVQAVYSLLGRAATPPVHSAAVTDHADRIFRQMDLDADGAVSLEELSAWCGARASSLAALDTVL